MEKPIYLDHHSTTPLDPEVFASMKPYFECDFGNPSSSQHSYGWTAQMAVKKARHQVAQLIRATEKEIFWTSGATESNNLALLGCVRHFIEQGETPLHVITSKVEHKAVLDVCQWMKTRWGVEVDFLDVNSYGQVELETLKAKLRPNTKLISIMAANNEVGSLNDIKEIGQWTREHGLIFHTDAAQAAGKVPLDMEAMNIDLLSLAAHKMYGPKGVGVLYVRQNPPVQLVPLMVGGGQEEGLRPGTLNVPGIVGLGKACELCQNQMEKESQRLSGFRDHLIQQVLEKVPSARLNGHPTQRLPHNISLSFSGLSADLFALGLSGLACSSSSACGLGLATPSHVLMALGHDKALARATLRMGLGRFTTFKEIKITIDKILQMVKKNYDMSVIL